jgi:HEAT repeat protein
MDNTVEPPPVEILIQQLRDGTTDGIGDAFRAYGTAETERRKQLLRSIRSLATDDVDTVSPVVSALASFLTDDDRSVRLTTAKLFVVIATEDSDAVVRVVDTLAERLAAEAEFYYVRARSAEALGYVAVDHPEEVATPELLADLRIGLSFDEPEVKEKLAKALAYVALGNPKRLRHLAENLSEHLDDENELVRYHLCTALVAVGCEYPDALADAVDPLVARLDDECAYIRGRAAEALWLNGRAAGELPAASKEQLASLTDDGVSFVSDRARVALSVGSKQTDALSIPESVGSLDTIRNRTDDIVTDITTPDGDECPHCGLSLPEDGPPMCPRCGAPY